MTATQPTLALNLLQRDEVATNIHRFVFESATHDDLPPFTAGAHIALQVPNGALRKYALCGDPAAGEIDAGGSQRIGRRIGSRRRRGNQTETDQTAMHGQDSARGTRAALAGEFAPSFPPAVEPCRMRGLLAT